MKIVHYKGTLRLEKGGDVRAVLDMCGQLAERGHDVSLLTYDPADAPREWHDAEPGRPRVVTVERLWGRLPRLGRAGLERARECIRDADVVHLHVPWDPVCRQLARIALRCRVPYVVSLHGMLDDWSMLQKGFKKRAYLALGGRGLLHRAQAVQCTAEAERDQSSKWYPQGHPAVVPYVVDVAPYLELPGPAEARQSFPEVFGDPPMPVVLFLSRLHEKKGLERLIEAAARLRGRGVDFKVAIAGTGKPAYVDSLRELGHRLGLDDRLFFLGFVGGTTKVSLYEAADVFVLPTSQENWGLVLTESLACRTPVVTTRGVDIWRELQRSGGAVIVESDPDELAGAIGGLLDDPDARQAMGRQARSWVLETLDPDRVIERYDALYRAAMDPSAAASARPA